MGISKCSSLCIVPDDLDNYKVSYWPAILSATTQHENVAVSACDDARRLREIPGGDGRCHLSALLKPVHITGYE